jgi:hypothetical protein
LGGSLVLGFYLNNQNSIKSPKTMCRKWVDTKSMTGKTTEGRAWGTGKIWLGRRSWLILPVWGCDSGGI